MSLSAAEEAPSPQTSDPRDSRSILGDVTSLFLSFYEAKYVNSSPSMIIDLGYYCATSQVNPKSTPDSASQGVFCF